MRTLAFHSDDLAATEEFLTAAYVIMSIGNGGTGPASAAVTRDVVGGVAYLRQLRLRGAHEELLLAHPGAGVTVTAIAASRGFGHPGRFAAAYRRVYGHSPQVTLYS